MGHRVSKQQQHAIEHGNNSSSSSSSSNNNCSSIKGRKKSSNYNIHRKLIDNLIHPNSNSINNGSRNSKTYSIKSKHEKNKINVLVLGTSESGKTTLVNQLRLMSNNGITKEERLEYRTIILFNIIEAMQSILSAMSRHDITIHCPKRKKIAEKLLRIDLDRVIISERTTTPLLLLEEVNPFPTTLDIYRAIRILWKEDDTLRLLYDRRYEYQLPTVNDTADYYFNITLERLSSSKEALINYLPTDQEILRANRKTTSITAHTTIPVSLFTAAQNEDNDASINQDNQYYNIIDVGGLRSHRKQWVEAFSAKPSFSTLLFIVSLSEYDQCLLEDSATNRMQESLLIFQSICDLHYFKKSSIILFFNKTDVLKEKLKSSPLEVYFPHYKGGNNYERACQFIMEQYKKITVKWPNKKIYTHFICALDTAEVQLVMSVTHDIIQANLSLTGLL